MGTPSRSASIGGRLAALMMMVFAGACAEAPRPPMRVATDVWIGNEMLAVADRAGWLDPAVFRRVEFSSNQEVLRALRNGTIESAALMLDEALVAAQDGADLVIVGAMDVSNGSDAIVGRSHLTTLADLKGQRVGVQLNSAGLQMLYRALGGAGMSISDVTVVSVPPDRHVRSFLGDDVDAENIVAIVTYDPMRTILLDGGGVDLYNSSSIPGDLVNVLVVRRDYLTAMPERGRALANAWYAGRAEFEASAAAREWAAHRQGLTVAQLERALKTAVLYDAPQSRALLDNPERLQATAHRFHYFMRQNGRLSRDISVERMFDAPPGSRP